MNATLDLIKPSHQLDTLKAEPQPGGHWELRFRLDLETDPPFYGRALAQFNFIGDQISCETELHLNDGEPTAYTIGCLIDGTLAENDAHLSVAMHDAVMSRFPFQCDGQALEPGRRYEGTVLQPCIEPETCNCEGATGTFTLLRIGAADG